MGGQARVYKIPQPPRWFRFGSLPNTELARRELHCRPQSEESRTSLVAAGRRTRIEFSCQGRAAFALDAQQEALFG